MDKLKKKLCLGDVLAAVFVLLIGLSAFAASCLGKTEGDVCVLRTPDGERVLPLSSDTVLDITSNGIDLRIVVENGEARVESSSCSDKVCVRTGIISAAGQTAVCVPAKLSLIIETEDGGDADFING